MQSIKKHTLLLAILLWTFALNSFAQKDTLWVGHHGGGTFIKYRVKGYETLFSLAKRFHTPSSAAARLNHLSYNPKLTKGELFKVPIGRYNYLSHGSAQKSRPLYFRVMQGNRLLAISRWFQVSRHNLQKWNKLPLPEVFAGQVLKVGWVRYDAPRKPPVKEKKSFPPPKNKADKSDNLPPPPTFNRKKETDYEAQFHRENDSLSLKETSGAVVFFKTKHPLKTGVYFALFDDAPRGSILSIYNPATQGVVYAKVIGKIPKISKYHKAVLALTKNAAQQLMTTRNRVFCKIKY